MCNNMVEEKAGVEKQHSKKGLEKNEHACIVDRVSWVSDFECPSSEKSKLVKVLTVPKVPVTSRNPRHTAGAHWHRYLGLCKVLSTSIITTQGEAEGTAALVDSLLPQK